MKSRANLLRLKHFQVEDKTRQLAQIDMMLSEFQKMHGDLQGQIEIEEQKSGITDSEHFAYPTFAKAARQRQENLDVSIRDLSDKRVNAEAALENAEEELKKAQKLDQRDGGTGGYEDVTDNVTENRAMMIG
ncbi:MAG: flagellar export protein FliJ [Pseudomonadota bacterium]